MMLEIGTHLMIAIVVIACVSGFCFGMWILFRKGLG